MYTFKQHLAEGANIKAIVDEVIDQMAEENYWNTDSILKVVRDRLMEIPEFRDDPRYLESAMHAVEYYVTT